MSLQDDASIERTIREHTEIHAPGLAPEIRMRLARPGSLLWDPPAGLLERLGCPHPFWAFAWGGGQALARYLLDHPEVARGRRVLSLGSGCGTEAIAAALTGATLVRATDLDPWALVATRLNAELNGVSLETSLLDIADARLEGWDLVLAAEVTYDQDSTDALLSRLTPSRSHASVLVADLDRGFLSSERCEPLAHVRAPSDIDVDGRFHKPATIYRYPARSV